MQEEVVIEKLVHGGQGLATLADGRKVFVWGALPGEQARVRIIKAKHSYAEAIAEEILRPSPLRVAPRDANYLATSPWQIMTLEAENDYKRRIVEELLVQAHVAVPQFAVASAGPEWGYRNKMEYSFWGDDSGLHLALHNRGSHHKSIVEGSSLAMPAVDQTARAVLAELQKCGARAGDLKTIIVRAAQDGRAAAALFVKPETFAKLPLPQGAQGLRVYHSNPKSPASVPTKLLYETGDATLHDSLLGQPFAYDVDSFFQVNLPIFEQALQTMKEQCVAARLTDMYAGVGSIGLSVASHAVELIELDAATAAMARVNAAASRLEVRVVEASAEKALQHITAAQPVIFDPPRAGLHQDVVRRALAVRPPQILYLSCNPATHARDLALLQEAYTVEHFAAFNFFPHTPHIETLAVLRLH